MSQRTAGSASPPSSRRRPPGVRRHTHGERVVTALVAALLLLMLVVVMQAVRSERARRVTAASALRDYAAIAAWRYARLLEQDLHDISQEVSRPLAGLRAVPGVPLPTPDILLPVADWTGRNEVAAAARFAFRLDLDSGELLAAGGEIPQHVATWLRTRLPVAAAAGGWDTHRTALDTIDGESWGILFRIVRREGEFSPRVLFGIAVDANALLAAAPSIHRHAELLPPALVGAPPQAEAIGIRLSLPAGIQLYERGPGDEPQLAGNNTLIVDQGALVVTATIAPALLSSGPLAGTGDLPIAPAVLLMMLALALGVLAVLQLRRSLELAQLREQFVASVSHELRTPLTQISLFGETLMEGRERSGEERRYFAGVIFREARRLAGLVENILRFSRDADAAESLTCETIQLAPELRQAVEAFEPIAVAARATVSVCAPPGLHVRADRSALRQILLNLLDNAVKYGPPAQEVQLSAQGDGGHVLISVIDQGPGIPAGDRERIFDPFVRLARPRESAVVGTGIGLSVVRTLARAMNGDVRVEDVNGQGGARITLRLCAPVVQ